MFSSLIWLWETWKSNPGIWPIRKHGRVPTPKISLAYSDPDWISDNYWKEDHSKINDHVFILKDEKITAYQRNSWHWSLRFQTVCRSSESYQEFS